MTEKEIRLTLHIIKAAGNYDSEAGHVGEDTLRERFIQYIADNYEGSLAKKARLVLSSKKFNFPRWCS